MAESSTATKQAHAAQTGRGMSAYTASNGASLPQTSHNSHHAQVPGGNGAGAKAQVPGHTLNGMPPVNGTGSLVNNNSAQLNNSTVSRQQPAVNSQRPARPRGRPPKASVAAAMGASGPPLTSSAVLSSNNGNSSSMQHAPVAPADQAMTLKSAAAAPVQQPSFTAGVSQSSKSADTVPKQKPDSFSQQQQPQPHRWQQHQEQQQSGADHSSMTAASTASATTTGAAAQRGTVLSTADSHSMQQRHVHTQPEAFPAMNSDEELSEVSSFQHDAPWESPFTSEASPQPLKAAPEDVLVVNTVEQAKWLVDELLRIAHEGVRTPDGSVEPAYFAVDTEVADIDIKEESPVGHGAVICFSIYCGPWANFNPQYHGGDGSNGAKRQSRIWVDLFSQPWQELQQQRQQEQAVAEAAARAAAEAAAAAEAEAVAAAAEAAAALQTDQDKPKKTGRRKKSKAGEEPVQAAVATAVVPTAAAAPPQDLESVLRSSSEAAKQRASQRHASTSSVVTISSVDANGTAVVEDKINMTQLMLSHPQSKGILHEFKRFLEADSVRKVWHNYGFDRHVFSNMGVACDGFDGDTMHMARLYDASRKLGGGYSLESLSGDTNVRVCL